MKITRNITPEFADTRGLITKILDAVGVEIKSVLIISSKPGSIRANHYHQKDSHYCYLLSGKMEYSERPIEGGEMETEVINAGDMVYTPPLLAHAMRFLEDSVFLTLATEHRGQTEYENDIVPIPLIQ